MLMNPKTSDAPTSAIPKAFIATTVGALALATGIYCFAKPRPAKALAQDSSEFSPVATVVPAHWDRAHRDEFVDLKSRGDSLAIDGKLQEAYDAYQQCVSRIADHDLTDPLVICTIKSAQENQSRLVTQMVGPINNSPAPATETDLAPAAPVVLTSLVQPLHDDRRPDDRATAAAPQPTQLGASKPIDHATQPLFGSGSNTPQTNRRSSGDSQPSNLGSNSNLPSMFQPFGGSDPGPIVTEAPNVTVRRKHTEPAAGVAIPPGTPTETVYVEVKARAPGSPPVTGTVDGQPYSVGADGAPGIAAFTVPIQPIPVTIDGKNYTFNGGTMSFGLPSGAPNSPAPGSTLPGHTVAEPPVATSPTVKPTSAGPSKTKGSKSPGGY